jgi:UDP-N-acetylmuramate--alanine ligase
VTKALTAVHPDHPELEVARMLGVPLEPWQQVVADAAVGHRLVGTAGTHGKSTTAGWLVHVLVAAGLDPSAFVGALLPPDDAGAPPSTARWGDGSVFVVEADEYAGNFDPFRPDVALLTSCEWDHPDVFADRSAVEDAFARWLGRMPDDGIVVANAADPGVEAVLDRVARASGPGIVAYALTDADPRRGGYLRGLAERFSRDGRAATPLLGRITGADPRGTDLELHGLDPSGGPLVARLPTAGRHNAANALAVAGAALVLGLPPSRIATGLASFVGVGRRLERKGAAAGVVGYHD